MANLSTFLGTTYTGAQGPQGPAGAQGPAATIAVGTVSTSGTTACSVTNSGTSGAAVFDFLLPLSSFGFNYVLKTTAYTAAHNDYILADTSSGAFTITCPLNPADKTAFYVLDATGYFVSNAVTIGRNGQTINSNSENAVLSTPFTEYQFVYVGGTWKVFSQYRAPSEFSTTPRLVGVNSATEGTTVNVAIANYQSSGFYTYSVTAGTAIQNLSNISWSLPTVSQDTQHTLTVTYNDGAETLTSTLNVNVLNINYTADAQVIVTNFSTSTYNNSWS